MKDKYFVLSRRDNTLVGTWETLEDAIGCYKYLYPLLKKMYILKGKKLSKKCTEVSLKAIERELS